MNQQTSDLYQFGAFRLDVRRKVLRHREQTIAMPLKELQVLSMLVRSRGELVTKDELLTEIWGESFVEESNLSRHIYLLRKTLKDLGAEGLIENVPRRGYRFTGNAREIEASEIVVEKHTRTRTLVEFQDDARSRKSYRSLIASASIAVLLTGTSVLFAALYMWSEPATAPIESMAVLPFKTLSTNESTSHIGVGLADILTTRISNIRGLNVRPVSSLGGLNNLDAVAAGNRLQVDAVLEGSIYFQEERVRVTARLVKVDDGAVVWSGEFEKLKRDELQLQSEIAAQIVPVLAVSLSPDEREAIAKRYTENPDAYNLYIRGRYEWNKRSTPGMVEAQRLFRNSIEADPGFALAYVGLADVLLTNQPSSSEAWAVISKALEIDPELAEAHASRGFHLMFLQWRWHEAEAAFKTSLELNPNYATAHHWYATLLAIKGETDKAKLEMQKAIELNPISHNFLADLGKLHYFSGEYAEAEKYCLKALEIYPDFTFAHEYLHYIYLKTGRYEQALAEIARADDINGAFAHTESKDGGALEKYRPVFQASGINGYLEHRYPGTPTAPETFYFYAMKHAFIGDREKALDYLEKSTDARMFLSAFLKAEPVFEHLRSEPRYHQILKKVGLA